MCGEQFSTFDSEQHHGGSPPRVRGTAQYYDVTNLQIRITPACAGNSEAAGLQWQDVEDHPRVCGEQ